MKKDWFIIDIRTEEGIMHTSVGDINLRGWNIDSNNFVIVSFYDKEKLLKPIYDKTVEPLCTINGFHTGSFNINARYEPTGLVNLRFRVVNF